MKSLAILPQNSFFPENRKGIRLRNYEKEKEIKQSWDLQK